MLNVVKEQKGGALLVRLNGSIEESVDFQRLIGEIPAMELWVNCKGVPRINSIGVKAWINYFKELNNRGVRVIFQECSTAIVEQINLISNFISGAEVESIFVPFSCENCKSELVGLFKTEALRKIHLEIPSLKCSKCGGKATFDDIPDEYFGFLRN